MTKKTKKVLLWTKKFIAMWAIFMLTRAAFDWIFDGTPMLNLNYGGGFSAFVTVLLFMALDGYAERHGLK